MNPILYITLTLIDLYTWAVLIYVIISWMISLGILNRYNAVVTYIFSFLGRVVEPVLNPIRRLLPSSLGFDISPILLFLMLHFVSYTIQYYALS